MKEKLKLGFKTSRDWNYFDYPERLAIVDCNLQPTKAPGLMITKPHKDIIIFIILVISFSISLYNLSQKGTFQINFREFGWAWDSGWELV